MAETGAHKAQQGMAIPLTAFAAGAVVALLVGAFGRVHDPSTAGLPTLGFDTVIAMKVVVATAAPSPTASRSRRERSCTVSSAAP